MLMILEPRHQRTHVDLDWVDVVFVFVSCYPFSLLSTLAALYMEHWYWVMGQVDNRKHQTSGFGVGVSKMGKMVNRGGVKGKRKGGMG